MDTNIKAIIIQNITGTGVISTVYISDESKLRVVISDADSGNQILVKGRITGQLDWDTLDTLNGSIKTVINIKTYDEVQLECTTYASTSNHVRVDASSFNEAGGSTTIDAPAGGTIDSDAITFTSSDNSVSITNDPLNNTIDFITVGSGGLSKYVQTFNNTSDWVLNGSSYELTVLAATHGNKANPVVETYETIAGVDDVIFPTIIRTVTNDIILQVTQLPDNRYSGKIIIF